MPTGIATSRRRYLTQTLGMKYHWDKVITCKVYLYLNFSQRTCGPNSSVSMGDITALSPAPVVDVQLFVEVLLVSFGGFRGKCLTEDQLNIDGSTPAFMLGDFDKPL